MRTGIPEIAFSRCSCLCSATKGSGARFREPGLFGRVHRINPGIRRRVWLEHPKLYRQFIYVTAEILRAQVSQVGHGKSLQSIRSAGLPRRARSHREPSCPPVGGTATDAWTAPATLCRSRQTDATPAPLATSRSSQPYSLAQVPPSALKSVSLLAVCAIWAPMRFCLVCACARCASSRDR